jgi:hypothetical protein
MKILILTTFLALTSTAHADLISGQKLKTWCEGAQWIEDSKSSDAVEYSSQNCKARLLNGVLDEKANRFCTDIADFSKINVNSDGFNVATFVVRKCLMTLINKKINEEDYKTCSKDMYKSSEKSIECISKSKFTPIEIKNNIRQDCTFVVGDYVQCPEGKYVFQGDKLSGKIVDSARPKTKGIDHGNERQDSNHKILKK